MVTLSPPNISILVDDKFLQSKRRGLEDGQLPRGMTLRDTDVEVKSQSLSGRHILLGVTGGIAAVDTIRLCREFRRHGAVLTVIMTPSAQKIITPLAVRWAAQCEVITDWDANLTSLQEVDAIVIAPATRDIIASTVHGLQHGPLLMALSAARTRKTPTLFVPSMHEDLAKEPITTELIEQLKAEHIDILWGEHVEGKMKNPSHEHIVAQISHQVNMQHQNTSIVITLGATKSNIDDIRYIANTSSGATGWNIADMLYRHGFDVTCVVGLTTQTQPKWLPLCIQAEEPGKMLKECKALSNDKIDVWIHAAAVLDYIIEHPVEGKIASQQGDLSFTLTESSKHILELAEDCKDAVRIGFKLESGIKQKDLIHRAHAQIQHAGMTAVIANRLEDLHDSTKPRAYLVDKNGAHFPLNDEDDLHEAILSIIEQHV